MKVLSNPIVIRMALLLLTSLFAVFVSVHLLRRMRRALTEDFSLDASPEPEQLPMHTYNAVIQQLKQQKYELQTVHLVEKRRAKTSENISSAVLSNLSSGILFLGTNGLVRTANTAAKNILGFASPAGMNLAEIFRQAQLLSNFGSREPLTEALESALRHGATSRIMQADYWTPAGEPRVLEITVSPVCTATAEQLGAACVITDKTEFAAIQKQQKLRGEMSAEMALALRTSLASISSYAQQLAVSKDAVMIRQLAIDIVSEAAQLDHTIGGFLAGDRASRGAGA